MIRLPERILVVRNDKLGDFMLAWPAFNVIRKTFPDARIFALVPEYTRPMAEICPWIDEIIIDHTGYGPVSRDALALRRMKFDASISFFINTRSGIVLFLAGISQRFAPATKIAQMFFNRTLKQRRSHSAKPEYEYNIDLAHHMARSYGLPLQTDDGPPYLTIEPRHRQSALASFNRQFPAAENMRLVIVHPGSGGSADNLSVDQYAALIREFPVNANIHFVITAGPGEEALAKQLSMQISDIPHSVFISKNGLTAFAEFISNACLFISGSTGVLHIAAAMNLPTIAFYPRRRSATSLRWQTLNEADRRLAISPNNKQEVEGLKNLDMTQVYREANEMIVKFVLS